MKLFFGAAHSSPRLHSQTAVEGLDEPFVGGPPGGLANRLGVGRTNDKNVLGHAGLAVAVGWFPLAVFTVIDDLLFRGGHVLAFLSDYGVHTRSLLAVPLLVLAEVTAGHRLGALAGHLRNTGLVAPEDLPRLNNAATDTIRLRDSNLIEIGFLGLVLFVAAVVAYSAPPQELPAWNYAASRHARSIAGWWQMLVSVPLLLLIICGWIWRLVLWCALLVRVSRLHLLLPPVHPDGAAGLKFLSLSLQAWSIVAFGLGMTFAGTIANQVTHYGASIFDYRYFIGGFAVLVTVLFTAPLLVFIPKLLETRRLGILHYGGLARAFGQEFEPEWLARTYPLGDDARRDSVFSSTTDYYSIAANAYAMSVIPISLIDVVALFATALLPFVPVVLMSVPAEIIVDQIKGLLF